MKHLKFSEHNQQNKLNLQNLPNITNVGGAPYSAPPPKLPFKPTPQLLAPNDPKRNTRNMLRGKLDINETHLDLNSELKGIVLEGDLNKIIDFRRRNPSIPLNITTDRDGSLLHIILRNEASTNSNQLYQLVKYLLENGSSPNTVDSMMISPLHIAAKNQQYDIVKLLLKFGANVNQTDNYNQNALHYAIKSNGTTECPAQITVKPLEKIDNAKLQQKGSIEDINDISEQYKQTALSIVEQMEGQTIRIYLSHIKNSLAAFHEIFNKDFDKIKSDYDKKIVGSVGSVGSNTSNTSYNTNVLSLSKTIYDTFEQKVKSSYVLDNSVDPNFGKYIQNYLDTQKKLITELNLDFVQNVIQISNNLTNTINSIDSDMNYFYQTSRTILEYATALILYQDSADLNNNVPRPNAQYKSPIRNLNLIKSKVYSGSYDRCSTI